MKNCIIIKHWSRYNGRIPGTFCYICPVFTDCSESRVLHIKILKERIRPISFSTKQGCSAKINAIIIRITCMGGRSSSVVRCLTSTNKIVENNRQMVEWILQISNMWSYRHNRHVLNRLKFTFNICLKINQIVEKIKKCKKEKWKEKKIEKYSSDSLTHDSLD